jgi:hypothetical protein
MAKDRVEWRKTDFIKVMYWSNSKLYVCQNLRLLSLVNGVAMIVDCQKTYEFLNRMPESSVLVQGLRTCDRLFT